MAATCLRVRKWGIPVRKWLFPFSSFSCKMQLQLASFYVTGEAKAAEELGSGEVKWKEEKTADGWMKVTNEGGATLGYHPSSGLKLIQVDGYAFKDLDKNIELCNLALAKVEIG